MNAPTSAQDLLTFAGRMIDPRLKRTVVVVGDRDGMAEHADALAEHYQLSVIQRGWNRRRPLPQNTLILTCQRPIGPFDHPVHVVTLRAALDSIVDQLQEAQ